MKTQPLSEFKRYTLLRLMVAGFVVLAVIFTPSVHAQLAAQPSSGATKVAGDGSVTMIIHKGYNVREIAKRYSRAHNVPFKITLAGLLAANPDAFAKGNPDVLIIGAPFVLPSRESMLRQGKPFTTAKQATEVVPATTAIPEAEAKSASVSPAPVTATPPPVGVAELTPAEALAAPTNNIEPVPSKDVDESKENIGEQFIMPIWAMGLLAVAALIFLVRIFRRTPETSEQINEVENTPIISPTPTSEKVYLPEEEVIASPSLQEVVTKVTQTSLNTPLNPPLETQIPSEHSRVVPVPSIAPAAPVIGVVPPVETPIASSVSSLGEGLDLDVAGFMKRYGNKVPVVSIQQHALVFDELLDHTHLQAWMDQHTPEDVLMQALEAHEEGYDSIADNMLADVLFRGDPEQCAMATRLRKAWNVRRSS